MRSKHIPPFTRRSHRIPPCCSQWVNVVLCSYATVCVCGNDDEVLVCCKSSSRSSGTGRVREKKFSSERFFVTLMFGLERKFWWTKRYASASIPYPSSALSHHSFGVEESGNWSIGCVLHSINYCMDLLHPKCPFVNRPCLSNCLAF